MTLAAAVGSRLPERRRHPLVWVRAVVLAASFAGVLSQPAIAEEPYFKGRTVKLVVTQGPAGYYDIGARLMARHWGKFIPGQPTVVVQNQTGAAGVGLANRFAAGAVENDGTTLGVLQRGVPQYAFIGYQGVRFDPLKLTWVGSLSSYATDSYVLIVNASHPAKTVTELADPKVLTRLGANNAGSTNLAFSLLARELFKLNVNIIRGYEGTAPIFLAQERHEVDGVVAAYSTILTSMAETWAKKEVVPVVQFGRKSRLPELAQVPIARELVKDGPDRALLEFAELPFFTAFPIAGPAGVPPGRLAMLQQALMEMAKDPEFLADAKKVNFDIDPIDGDAVREALTHASKTPKDVMDRYNVLLSGK
jgi:tripartite-type tricarboxylate transporter receptor subunit TctC